MVAFLAHLSELLRDFKKEATKKPHFGKQNPLQIPVEGFSAVRTRLELATPGVTGRYSNQLNYRTNLELQI